MTTIVVTRPAHQADNLCRLLEEQGLTVAAFPLVDIQPVNLSDSTLDDLLSQPADWVFFVSVNAVNFGLVRQPKLRAYCEASRIVAVGQATEKALQSAEMAVSIVPEKGFNSEALLAMAQFQSMQGQHCLIVRGVGGRELLADSLRTRGAQVDYLEVYSRQAPSADPAELITLLQAGRLAVISISNAEALHNLLALLPGQPWRAKVLARPLVVISDRLRQVAVNLGFTCVVVSDEVSDRAISQKIIELVNGE